MKTISAHRVLTALDRITGGRIPPSGAAKTPGAHPFIVEKSSGFPGKAVLEFPGLVFGEPDHEISALGVGMTLTESMIELAGAMGLDAVLVHHPVADGASAGGVALKPYLELYGLALFELHEAFHGLHPGIPFLHGHRVMEMDHAFAGIPGNIVISGRPLPEIQTAGDILERLKVFTDPGKERQLLEAEAKIRGCTFLSETALAASPAILNNSGASPVENILHIFPHTGFTARHLQMALDRYPGADTIIASISRVRDSHGIVTLAREKGLTLVLGNSHALEIFENGLPLALALQHELPGLRLTMLRERITATPLEQFGNENIRAYGRKMAAHITGLSK